MQKVFFQRLVGLLGAVLFMATPAQAEPKKKVACTLTTIESLVHEIGGDRVEAFSLSAGDQDPHFVSPTPSLMKRVREADLLLEIGMQLELWADEVANGSGNSRIFRAAAGRTSLSAGIPGQFDHPRFLEAMNHILEACDSHRVPAAIVVASPKQAMERVRQGFRCLSYWGDIWLLQQAISEGVQAIRLGLSKRRVQPAGLRERAAKQRRRKLSR